MPSSKDASVLYDLSALSERLTLASDMLVNSSSPATDEALLAVIGFLEACAPRLLDLIDAGASGVLEEETLMKCLSVNDALTSLLAGDVFDKGRTGEAVRAVASLRGVEGSLESASDPTPKGDVDLLGIDLGPANGVASQQMPKPKTTNYAE